MAYMLAISSDDNALPLRATGHCLLLPNFAQMSLLYEVFWQLFFK